MAAIELFSTPLFSDANLVSYYRLESNGNDSKGSNNLTDYNSPTYVAAKFNNGSQYNGSNQYSRCASAYGMTYASSRSISFWIKMIAEPSSGNIVLPVSTIWATNPGNYSSIFYTNNAGTYKVYNNSGAEKTGQLGTSNWHHIVLTHNHGANETEVYVDASKGSTGTSFTGDYSAQTTSLTLGASHVATPSLYTNCIIDDVAIFNDILTQQEVSDIYNGNYPTSALKVFMTTRSKFF